MEERVAHWVDLGLIPYQEAYDLQLKMVAARRKEIIPDTILSVQHPLTVSFGSDKMNNQFSDKLISSVKREYGNYFTHENVVEYLRKQGIEFVEVSRGGGATVLAPGQFVYYPVVNVRDLTGKEPLSGMEDYKNMIYKTLFSSLSGLGILDINISERKSFGTRFDRKDTWIQRNGITLKMGSKGIRYSNGIAHQGFVLYVDNKGIEHFGLVKPCGFNPSEVSVSSVESVTGKPIAPEVVHDKVREAISQNFRYRLISDITKEELLQHLNKELRD